MSTQSINYCICHSGGSLANIHTNLNDCFRKANGHHHHVPTLEKIELLDLKNEVKESVLIESSVVPKIQEEELTRSNLSCDALILALVAVDASTLLICYND